MAPRKKVQNEVPAQADKNAAAIRAVKARSKSNGKRPKRGRAAGRQARVKALASILIETPDELPAIEETEEIELVPEIDEATEAAELPEAIPEAELASDEDLLEEDVLDAGRPEIAAELAEDPVRLYLARDRGGQAAGFGQRVPAGDVDRSEAAGGGLQPSTGAEGRFARGRRVSQPAVGARRPPGRASWRTPNGSTRSCPTCA